MNKPLPSSVESTADQAKRNTRLAWIHVGLALAVLAGFVFNAMTK